tara:strand:+ start:2793 stop:3569 length:777 start_codon:yes stop_codon:yes gene_type:complete
MAKTRSEYVLDGRQHILLQGLPKTGKTTLALQFSRPYLIDVDNNIAGAIQGSQLKDRDFKWDTPLERPVRDPKTKALTGEIEIIDPIKDPVGYEERFRAIFDEAFKDPDVDTVILDSATAITNMFVNAICKRANKPAMEIQLWQNFIKYWIDMITIAKSKHKRVVLIAHEELYEDKIDGGTKRMLLLPSKARATIPGMFSDVWETYVASKMVSGKPTYEHMIRCKADNKVSGLGASHPAAKPSFSATWDEVSKVLNAK